MTRHTGRQPRAQSRGNDLRAGGEGRAGGPAAGYGRTTQPRGAAFHDRMKKYADGGGVTDPLAGMSPVDLARLRAELAAKPREMTVDERWRNYATTGADVAGSLPVIGNVMSAYDAYEGGKGAVDAAQAGDVRGAALNTAAAGLGALGAVTGLPLSKASRRRKLRLVAQRDPVPMIDRYLPTWGMAGEVARDARSTAAAFPVYHGTPHTVDRFRMDRVGTGEGAQVYGHGLYFAENPEVARWYRDQLGNLEFEVPPSALEPSTAHSLARTAASQKLRGDELNRVFMRNWQASLDRALATGDEALAAKSREALKIGDHVSRQNVRRQGNVYRVDIDAEPDHLLDLDLPLVRQSPRVQEAVRKLGIDPVEYRDGHWLQKEIWRRGDDDTPAGASRMMREVGIPGNRYLDQGSRSQAGGSRNYVIWDDSIIGPPTKEPYANGGTAARVGEYMRGGRVTVGAVEGATGGRTDALAVDVPEGAYVIPADVVAALGEGNTTAGMRQLEQQFGRPRHASGGRVVPIMVSDGEFVVSPEHVEAIGGADVLDRFVTQRRRAYADQLARMPGPKQ